MFANIIMATRFPVSYSAQAAMYSNATASQTAGTYYLQGGASDIAAVIDGNLRVTGNVQVDGNEVVGGSLSAASLAATGAVTGASVAATGAVTAASVAATGAVTAATATVTGGVNCGGLLTAGNVGCGTASVTAALTAGSLTVSNDSTVNSGDLVMGQVSGEAGQMTAGPVLAGPGMLLPAPPATLTVAREVVPVTKAITVGAAAVSTTFADLNAWINDVRPHRYFIGIMSQTTISDGNLNFGSFDYYSYGSSAVGAPPTSAPVAANYVGRTGLVTTFPSAGTGPYQLFFNWGGDPIPNVLYIYIKVIM